MTAPLYIVRDNLLSVDSAPMDRAAAGQLATRQSVEAGQRGEAVATEGGMDRFTVVAAPRAKAPDIAYSTLQVEAALCLYEAMIDARMESTSPEIEAAFEAAGSATMRHHAIALAPFALSVHALIPEDVRFGHAYDFGIIPAILATVRWTHAGYVLPDVTAAAAEVQAALQDA